MRYTNAEYEVTKITYGSFWAVSRCPKRSRRDTEPIRQAKEKAGERVRRWQNDRNSTFTLAAHLYGDFYSPDSYFLTFTFNDESLPANFEHAAKYFPGFMRKLRRYWRRRGREVKFVYVPENKPRRAQDLRLPNDQTAEHVRPWESGSWARMNEPITPEDYTVDELTNRFHIHAVMRLQKADFDEIRSLWPYGRVHIEKVVLSKDVYFRLANYLTKELRNGRKLPGEKAYICSKNLFQPETEKYTQQEWETIQAPPGAISLQAPSTRTDVFGLESVVTAYLLPESTSLPLQRQEKSQNKRPRKRKQAPPKK